MVGTSNMISCSQSNTSCMTDSVQLCDNLVAEFTPWHSSLGGKLIPPSSMPPCAALHQKAAYWSNPSRPSLIWNLLWLAIVAFMRCFPPCYFPAFLQFSPHFRFEISEYHLWTVLPESSVYLLNNIDEMENRLSQHGIASWSRLNEDYIS